MFSTMMSSLIAAAGVALVLLFGGAGGHMVMNKPTPYNFDIQPLLQVDPLSGGLYPFPCHNQYGFTTRTPVEAGGATLVNFTGGAQHGGGSCQFSITYDEPVNGGNWNKSASFKTIYSIIGGCPAVFTDESRILPPAAMDNNKRADSKHCGNDSSIDCIRQFMVPIPKFLKNGPATFAWTWFNKLGNKEMYMNCAPINITGGTGDEKLITELSDIFIANYPNDPEVPNCITGTSADKVVLNFPKPGRYGRVLEHPLEPATKPSGYCSQIPPASSIPSFEHTYSPATTTSPATFPLGHAPPAGSVTSVTGSLPIPGWPSNTTAERHTATPTTTLATVTVTVGGCMPSQTYAKREESPASTTRSPPTDGPPTSLMPTLTISGSTDLPPATTTTAPIGEQPVTRYGSLASTTRSPPTDGPPTSLTPTLTISGSTDLPPVSTTRAPIGPQPIDTSSTTTTTFSVSAATFMLDVRYGIGKDKPAPGGTTAGPAAAADTGEAGQNFGMAGVWKRGGARRPQLVREDEHGVPWIPVDGD